MLQIITPPAGLPIDVIEARLHVKQDLTTDDSLLRRGIQAAARFAETQIERALLATRFRLVLDCFPGPSMIGVPSGVPFSLPGHAIILPRTPLLQVVSIMYLDMAGAWQTMPSTDYVVDDSDAITRITPVFGKIWPIPMPQIGSVRVLFDAGYATVAVANATANTLALGLWKTLAVNDAVRVSNSGGALPAPLQPSTDYYVQSVADSVITLAATAGGAVIDLTDTGTGTSYLGEIPDGIISWMLLRLGSLYENREEVALMNRGKQEPLPFVDGLLDPYRTVMM